MNIKKLSILLLAVVLLIPFTACNPQNDTSNVSVADNSDVSTESTTSSNVLFEGLPTDKYDGREIKFLVGGMQQGERYQSREILSDDLNDELINDSVYERNSIVEEQFDVVISGYATDAGESIQTIVRQLNQAQDTEYDILAPFMNDAASMASEGFFYNLKDISNMRLDGAYWDQRANEDLEIMNKLYFTTGHISILDNECTQCLIFNKGVAEQFNAPDFYQLVLDGEWTIDKMIEIAKTVTTDSDGVTGMTYEDTWGLYINDAEPTHMFIAAGQRFIQKDGDGNPVITIDTDEAQNVISKLANVMGDRTASIIIEDLQSIALSAGYSDCYYLASEQLANGKALLRTMCLVDLLDIADKSFEYGILPLPKYDENQDEYYSNVSTFPVPGYCIPIQSEDKDLSALILSAMCEASTDTLDKAYYEEMLKNRRLVDEESTQMLDIIFNNRVYDLGVVFNWGGIRDIIPTAVKGGQNTFASTWESSQTAVNSAMTATLDAFAALE